METSLNQSQSVKRVAIVDFKLLSMENSIKEFESPANAMIAKGIKIKIKDLENNPN
jgi:hypothetical protein